MQRMILLAGGLLACATVPGCGDAEATRERPADVVIGKAAPLPSTMPPGAEDAMKKSLKMRPKPSNRAGEVAH